MENDPGGDAIDSSAGSSSAKADGGDGKKGGALDPAVKAQYLEQLGLYAGWCGKRAAAFSLSDGSAPPLYAPWGAVRLGPPSLQPAAPAQQRRGGPRPREPDLLSPPPTTREPFSFYLLPSVLATMGRSEPASKAQVEAAFSKLAETKDPANNANSAPEAAQEFQQLQKAKEALLSASL